MSFIPKSHFSYSAGGSIVQRGDLYNLARATNTCFRYDFGADAWVEIASMLSPRMYHACAVVEGVIYALGGETGPGERTDVHK
jgi:hypothetical protein